MTLTIPIRLDHYKKKITVVNNRPLYESIKRGEIESVFPIVHVLIHRVVGSVDEVLGWAARALSRLVEAVYYHEVCQWTVGLASHISVSPAKATASGGGATVTASSSPQE